MAKRPIPDQSATASPRPTNQRAAFRAPCDPDPARVTDTHDFHLSLGLIGGMRGNGGLVDSAGSVTGGGAATSGPPTLGQRSPGQAQRSARGARVTLSGSARPIQTGDWLSYLNPCPLPILYALRVPEEIPTHTVRGTGARGDPYPYCMRYRCQRRHAGRTARRQTPDGRTGEALLESITVEAPTAGLHLSTVSSWLAYSRPPTVTFTDK